METCCCDYYALALRILPPYCNRRCHCCDHPLFLIFVSLACGRFESLVHRRPFGLCFEILSWASFAEYCLGILLVEGVEGCRFQPDEGFWRGWGEWIETLFGDCFRSTVICCDHFGLAQRILPSYCYRRRYSCDHSFRIFVSLACDRFEYLVGQRGPFAPCFEILSWISFAE